MLAVVIIATVIGVVVFLVNTTAGMLYLIAIVYFALQVDQRRREHEYNKRNSKAD